MYTIVIVVLAAYLTP